MMKKFLLTVCFILVLHLNVYAETTDIDATKQIELIAESASSTIPASKDSDRIIYVGTTVQIVVSHPDNIKLQWKSTSEDVAKITQTGKITPLKKGKATFIGTGTYNNEKYTLTYNAYVRNPYMTKKKIIINKGQSISANMICGLKEVSYKSTKPKVVSVNKNGIITAKKAGKCAVNIKAENNKTYKLNVVVKGDKKITFNNSLTTKKGKVILKFNSLGKNYVKGKIVTRKNKYLKKTTEDYYFVKTKNGDYVALLLTKKPLPEYSGLFGAPAVIKKKTKLGYLGEFTNMGIVGTTVEGLEDGKFDYFRTNQGTFYNLYSRYWFDLNDSREVIDYVDMLVMKKNGYYITLYGQGDSLASMAKAMGLCK